MFNQGKKNIILYSNCCTGQNRNRYMLTMLWYACSKLNLDSIQHKFLQIGHSFNEGDSMHSAIERASRHIHVYTPTHWGLVIQSASHKRKYMVKKMMPKDLLDFKKFSRCLIHLEKDADKNKISWLKIRSFRIAQDDPNKVYIKYSFDGQPVVLDLFKKGRRASDAPTVANIELRKLDALRIDADKYKDLLKICEIKIIPFIHHDYYKNIAHK